MLFVGHVICTLFLAPLLFPARTKLYLTVFYHLSILYYTGSIWIHLPTGEGHDFHLQAPNICQVRGCPVNQLCQVSPYSATNPVAKAY